ncbi:Protein CBG08463 [Caenorhabditis briggsae]|uniref:Saposin B-type domain-containing protein n=2 Tax=Caenorhabditis briggsae TaxID=6238 RepID=A0AAE9DWH8_CAEBR|nr:Protein CBG08463 [Caenorhabditis briggsae]ULU13370.1 hypothetical protein L3Y34_016101 [Caenorhabditis briggsae]UMM14316.1 hypothetical protein L5515_002166 [Caenorhabditis briggsae]CAP28281.1 Protein CBG08463 [Caenorhabditis briggsae]
MKVLLFSFLIVTTVIPNVASISFLESLCLKCNTTVEMLLPPKIDTFYTLSDLTIKNLCTKLSPENLEDTCYSVFNVPLRIQYNIIWTFLSPFRELICMPLCIFD